MSQIYYQDWVVKAGDPPAVVLGHLFKTLHGTMRKHGHNVVIVPIDLSDDYRPMLKAGEGAPAGLRVYMSSDAKQMVDDHLSLSVAVADSLIAKPVVKIETSQDDQFVIVRRLTRFGRRDGHSEIQRFIRRNPGVDPSGKIAATKKLRSKRMPSEPASFIQVEKAKGSYRVYLSSRVQREAPSGERLMAQNTYGAGHAPLAGLQEAQ